MSGISSAAVRARRGGSEEREKKKEDVVRGTEGGKKVEGEKDEKIMDWAGRRGKSKEEKGGG